MTLDDQIQRLATHGGTRADCRALAAHGASAVDAIAPYLATGWRAAIPPSSTLRMVRGDGVPTALAVHAQAAGVDARLAAIDALGHGRDAGALEVLVDLLAARRTERWAAEALGSLGDAAALESLRERLTALVGDDPRAIVTHWIATGEALQVVKVLVLGRALARLGDLRLAALTAWLSGHDAGAPAAGVVMVRNYAVAALPWYPTAEATAALVTAQRDPHAEISISAIQAIGRLGRIECAAGWFALLDARPDRQPEIVAALGDLAGDAPAAGVTAPELRRWWLRASARLGVDRCWWRGQPASPGPALDALTEPGGRPRALLEAWTGIDFVDVMPPSAAGDDHDVARARAWWQSAQGAWEPGALYRAGRKHDVAPIVAALRAG